MTRESAATWDLVQRYDRPLPRYTSYPTVPAWHDMTAAEAAAAYARAAADRRPLSLYVHVPFCDRMCLYCGCNVVVTHAYDRIHSYIDALLLELDLLRQRVGPRPLAQLHFGGGTPTMLSAADFDRLLSGIAARFTPLEGSDPGGVGVEMSVEIDPGVTRREHLEVARRHGLNRISIGVQDFGADVQATVERFQSVADAQRVFDDARALGFHSINVDLMYGLPTQTPEHLARSARQAVQMGADRLAIFGYAHVPWLKPHQRKLQSYGIPGQRERWEMAATARGVLLDAGFVPVGLDHFARPTDELAVAAREHRLWRNFQGYTVLEPGDLIAVGVSAIGDVGGVYLQNVKRLSEYHAALDEGRLPLEKGMRRTVEDEERRRIINALMCNLSVDLGAPAFAARDFRPELEALRPLADDGLCEIRGRRIDVTERGRVFVRNVASVFDTYLRAHTTMAPGATPRFSRSV